MAPTAAPRLLHELFWRTQGLFPERPALEIPRGCGAGGSAGRTFTYGQLGRRARGVRAALAPYLDGERVVAVLLPRVTLDLFAAQIGVLSAGAAFVCPDLSVPDRQLDFVLQDAGVVAVLTDAAGKARLADGPVPADRVIDVATIPPRPDPAAAATASWVTPTTLAYLIYTSGTTGRPKGVMIEHAGIVDLITQDLEYFAVTATDRIAQGASHAFDSSVEETWVAFASGATLVVMDDDVIRSGPDLVRWLRDQRISILMPTPTMLRATGCLDPAAALPDLRLVYAGGEAMAQELADRWAPGRWLENGYGPTECTVTATRVRLRRGAEVTIGTAIPGRTAHVLDAQLEPLADGGQGELCLAGIGLARGYLGQPELTAVKFPHLPGIGRIYRTGDLVTRGADGNLHYVGRSDAQVKIRGYRVELEAIEAELAAIEGVRAAACCVQGPPGREQLVGFLVWALPARPVAFAELGRRLRAVLPESMIPGRFASIEQLPTTVSGKLDRRALPDLSVADPGSHLVAVAVAPRDALEQRIAAALVAALQLPDASIDADFFDLGGTSLGAAELISVLREHDDTACLAVRDVYEVRTIAGLAARVRRRFAVAGDGAVDAPAGSAAEAPAGVPAEAPAVSAAGGRPLVATMVQATCLGLALVGLSSIAYAALFLVLPELVLRVGAIALLLLAPPVGLLLTVVYTPLSLALAVLGKRVLIGRYTRTRQPVFGGFYLRHWLVTRLVRGVPWGFLQGTVWHGTALRALGARIGARVHLHRGVDLLDGGWDLLDIGDDVTLAQDARVGLVHLEHGQVVVDAVRLERGCTLDVRAGVSGDSVVGENAYLTALSSLAAGGRIPAGELWDGIPARPAGRAPEPPAVDRRGEVSPRRHALLLIGARCLLASALGLPFLVLGSAAILLSGLSDDALLAWLYAPTAHPWVSLTALVIVAVQVGVAVFSRALLLRWMRPVPDGSCSRFHPRYIRIWLRTGLVSSAGEWLAGSLWWPVWLRLAGMRLGPKCEISTIIDVLPENVAIGAASFFADGIYLAGARLHRGTVTTASTTLSDNTFLGNHVVVPAGARLPSDLLLGVCTVADQAQLRAGSAWFGHPPFELPRREVVEVDRSLTHDPTPGLFLNRVFWESLRFVLPAVAGLALLGWFAVVAGMAGSLTAGVFFGLGLPAATLAAGIAPCLVVLGLKWLLLGRVRPGQHGLWSGWCCRWDFLYVAWGFLARAPVAQLGGTLLLAWYLRAMGVRIGRRVVLGGGFAQVVDPDMLEFADGATFDGDLQAHSFEDRVLKIGKVHLGAGSTVRRGAVVMYGARIGAGCRVAPHSVVMKHEVLRAHHTYEGCPTR